MSHGHFLHKYHVVGWPLWAIRAHSSSPFLLLIHSRSALLSVPKLLGDLYTQSSPAFPEQGLSAQETCTHWAPGWCRLFLSRWARLCRLPSPPPCPWSSDRDNSTASGMAFLASHVTPSASSQQAVKTQICGSNTAWLSIWHLCPVLPSGRWTLLRTLGERARAEIQR